MPFDLSRRNFLRGLLGVAATAAVPVRAVADFIGPQFERYTSYFRWNVSSDNLSNDWRYVARIANIEAEMNPPAFAEDIFVPLHARSPAMEALADLRAINAMSPEERAKASAAFVREGLETGLFDD
jgi:hypothetical protein